MITSNVDDVNIGQLFGMIFLGHYSEALTELITIFFTHFVLLIIVFIITIFATRNISKDVYSISKLSTKVPILKRIFLLAVVYYKITLFIFLSLLMLKYELSTDPMIYDFHHIDEYANSSLYPLLIACAIIICFRLLATVEKFGFKNVKLNEQLKEQLTGVICPTIILTILLFSLFIFHIPISNNLANDNMNSVYVSYNLASDRQFISMYSFVIDPLNGRFYKTDYINTIDLNNNQLGISEAHNTYIGLIIIFALIFVFELILSAICELFISLHEVIVQGNLSQRVSKYIITQRISVDFHVIARDISYIALHLVFIYTIGYGIIMWHIYVAVIGLVLLWLLVTYTKNEKAINVSILFLAIFGSALLALYFMGLIFKSSNGNLFWVFPNINLCGAVFLLLSLYSGINEIDLDTPYSYCFSK